MNSKLHYQNNNTTIPGLMRLLAIVLVFTFAPTNTAAAHQPEGNDKPKRVVLTMEQAISRALEKNNQVRAAKFGLQKARWDKKHAWTLLLPTLSFNTRYTWIDDSTFALRDFSRYFSDPNSPFDIPQTVFQSSYFSSFDVSMTLFNGALLNGISLANANVDMSEHFSESTRENMLFLVISSYLNVLKSQEILKVQQEYQELSKLNFEKAERMHNAGRYSKTEALRWKVDYQQQKSVVVNSESVLRNDRSVLHRVLNTKTDEEIDIVPELPKRLLNESRKLALLSDEEILEIIQLGENELVRMNAALAAAKSNTEVSRLLHRNEYASYLPNVTLSYTHAWWENNTLALDNYSPKTLMINVSIPIFTSFQNLTSVKSSYYEYKQSQEEFFDQLQNMRLLLTETANRLINLKTQRELNKAEVEYNEHNYRVVEQQRERGLLSNIEFIDAKLNLQNAKLNEINSHYDFISAMVELHYLLGRLGAIVSN
ncbi:MAG: TolC family protein [bacterium]